MVQWHFGTGADSLDYWKEASSAKKTPVDQLLSESGIEKPAPTPATSRAWAAYLRVCDCRHVSFGGLLGANWADVAAVLDLWGDWTPTVQRHLAVCFNQRLLIDAGKKKVDQDKRKAEAESKRRKPHHRPSGGVGGVRRGRR